MVTPDQKISNEQFRKTFADSVKKHVDKSIFSQKALDELLKNVHYHQGAYDDKGDFEKTSRKITRSARWKNRMQSDFLCCTTRGFLSP